ncbi:hypothetical protein Cgig2_024553 [Carnegiea gigantea]|uniref:Ubiquitin-like protease family profile domain-containing protein n=1 Tax=Carnegiea gigantea TaxID=171969 RepID=A0A9Q1GV34_9CARY|nr:hypothetical protein Cgig2_024553 [Carnegiea gigantea]
MTNTYVANVCSSRYPRRASTWQALPCGLMRDSQVGVSRAREKRTRGRHDVAGSASMQPTFPDMHPPPQMTMCTSEVLSADNILKDASVGKFRSYHKHPIPHPFPTVPDGVIFHILLPILLLTDPHVRTCKTEWKLSPDGKSLDVLINTQLNPTVEQVMLPLYDEHTRHWLLMVVDLQCRRFTVYDSLPPLGLTTSTNAPHWSLERGYDCGVFVMVFMDVLALQEDTLCFSQDDIRALRDKCLTDLLRGRIRNLPLPLTVGCNGTWIALLVL